MPQKCALLITIKPEPPSTNFDRFLRYVLPWHVQTSPLVRHFYNLFLLDVATKKS